MTIKYRTIDSTTIKNRKITFLFIDNKLDIPSARFLANELRNGGRNGGISGPSSHKGKAVKIGELYRHLHNMGKCWRTADESDIKTIRNAMLCWDYNDNDDLNHYNYAPISNDSMNQKLSIWFKFYKFMEEMREDYSLILRTKKVRKFTYGNALLSHLNKRTNKTEYVEQWVLKVKKSPSIHTYHAISRIEFRHFSDKLKNDDIVYRAIALLMVETGLRASAALSINIDVFKSYFKHLNAGKDYDDCIKFAYMSKGGEIKNADLPIRTIATIQKEYLSRIYLKRKALNKTDSESMWLNKKGREINYSDLQRAFKRASKDRNLKTITPHWMRHTFATWTLLDFAHHNNLPLANTGIEPSPLFMILLSQKLGHASPETTKRYIMTALSLMGVTSNDGPVMSFDNYNKNSRIKDILKREAVMEFGDEFDIKKFNATKYGISRGVIVK